MPTERTERKAMIEMELNHGRLAMFAFIGILYQEYILGEPIFKSDISLNWSSLVSYPYQTFQEIISIFNYVISKWSQIDGPVPSSVKL